MVGLLTPSGIYANKGASKFLKQISTTNRLAYIFDFENRRTDESKKFPKAPDQFKRADAYKSKFFPGIDGRLNFCVFIAGGEKRHFDSAQCAFFLKSVEDVNREDCSFTLKAEDSAHINPNTGTVPVFRTKRDAEIVKDIYKRVPILVDHRGMVPRLAWPVHHRRGFFHMTQDSRLFHTAEQLKKKGFYRVAVNRWKKGEEDYVPSYEGKMIKAFDHRAASIVVILQNIKRPASLQPATEEQHANPNFDACATILGG